MPPIPIVLERRLRWADADPAGRLYFPRIFEVVEEAEHELLRLKWPTDRPGHKYDFPRVNVNCNFLRVIILGAPYRLRLVVGRLGGSSIRYDYQVFDADEQLAIEGTMTVVVMQDGKTVEIPPELRKALES
jgi:YbgC/YbaW family acyl-CoA thioester hydrolase